MVVIYFKDHMEDLPNIPNQSYDLALVDPPYGLNQNLARVKRRCRLAATKVQHKFDWDGSIPSDTYFEHLNRISKRQIIWGGNYFPSLGKPFKTPRRQDYDKFIKDNPTGWIIWDKVNGNCHYNDCELAYISGFDESVPTEVFYYMWNGMMQGKKSFTDGFIMEGNKSLYEPKIHPTQKPITLYKFLYSKYCKPNWTVIDTGIGSGSNAIAAYEFGVDFTGYEKEVSHFFPAKDWILRETARCNSQLNLFRTDKDLVKFVY